MAKVPASTKNLTTPTMGLDPNETVEITDALGRKLKIKPIDVLYESQLTRLYGSEAATNPTYMMGFVYPAASVCEIDGVPCARPTTQQEIDDAIQRLGREGFAAFLQHLQTLMDEVKKTSAASVENKSA